MQNYEEIINILQLINSENLGPVTFYKLIKEFGSSAEAIKNANSINKKISLLDRDEAVRIFEEANKKNITIISYLDDIYPDALKQISDAPPILYIKGDIKTLLNPNRISIVGVRNASINGRKTASRIAFDLTNQDIVVVSGMARGIDASAHKGALYAKQQKGPTIAVLGTGVDIPYPEENKQLYEQIVEQGCVISELCPGTLPQSGNFPRRNRIVAALSAGTLVVEANAQSGSLITAKQAADYGKLLFAVPGAPSDARSCGPNQLIKQGAFLAENADDILKTMQKSIKPQIKINLSACQMKISLEKEKSVSEQQLKPETKIIDYLSADGVYVDEVIRASGMSASEVALELLELEMNGQIERQSGNKVALVKQK